MTKPLMCHPLPPITLNRRFVGGLRKVAVAGFTKLVKRDENGDIASVEEFAATPLAKALGM